MNRYQTSVRLIALACAASTAAAQTVPRNPQSCDDPSGDYPCSYQIQTVSLQPSPGVFKFQARVSQAKLPVGEGTFNRVIVRVVRGTTTLCQEEFTNVQVQGSVLNLELGRGMTCELDQVIAENADLNFQLCLGGEANCLRPIQLGTTPYAIKSTFARTAQEAHLADVAGQANYAHRTTADRDLFLSKELGFGYFDFATPYNRGTLYPADTGFTPYASGGFIQWAPLSEQDPTLHICARDDATDQPRMLERLVLASNATNVLGSLNVTQGGVHVSGASDITGTTTVRGVLKVDPPASGANGLQVTGPTTLNGSAAINGAVTVTVPNNAPAMTVTGNSDFGVLTVRQLIVTSDFTNRGTNTISGATNLGGVSSDFSVGGNLTVLGGAGSSFNGPIAVTNGLSFRASTGGNGGTALSHTSGNTLTVNPGNVFSGGAVVDSPLSVRGVLSVTGESRLGTVLRFTRGAGDESNAGTIGYRAFDTTALDIVGAGAATPGNTRRVRIWDILAAGKVETGDAALTGALTVGGAATVSGALTVTGETAVTGPVKFKQNTGDDPVSAVISYRPSYDSNALGIVGVGTAGNRKVRLWDDVTVDDALSVTGNLSVAGGTIANTAADGQVAVSQNFAFRDTGDTWLRLRTGPNSETYADLAVNKLWLGGELQAWGGITMPHTCRNLSTTCNSSGGGELVYLDRHSPACSDDEAMVSWHLSTCPGGIRVDYRCCGVGK
ncbi:MAG: hypothetical protein HY904_20480 [Deltaproteobacteria bacterium]|nr:hypothetical protein [Deltaproteobacteria bacterium]